MAEVPITFDVLSNILKVLYLPGHGPNQSSVCQWSMRPGFNLTSSHTKNSKNGTWYCLA